ncbi:MAG: RluA family pseudouridine synthase [Phycisphaeraceae bacterium]|nr:RluA family pseudouridine synthase [Phycisphaeraceae bacterium]
MVTQTTTVAEPFTGRIDHVVAKLTGWSRARVTGLFEANCVRVNGNPCGQTFTRVKPGDVVELRYDPQRRYKPPPPAWKDTAFKLVFEDEHILVVDKSPMVLTVPTGDSPGRTLWDAVNRYLSRSGKRKEASVVHRLDRGTSGLLVFAKSPGVAKTLKDQFADHKPYREYLALVAGLLPKQKGTFKSYLATAANLDRYSTPDTRKGQLAITHYQVEQKLADTTLVRCRLETGRRNQIRVHFAEIDHPVLGDPRYRPDLAKHPRWRFRRLALHAGVLGFEHPVTGKSLRFESPVPWEFERVIGRG